MRRSTLAIGAATAATLASLTLAPVAGAQSFELLELANGEIATADCSLVETALTSLNLVDETTTRGELVADLNGLVGNDFALGLLLGTSINAIGDRALECDIVQSEPQDDILAALLASSEGGSSEDLLPVLSLLSSAAL